MDKYMSDEEFLKCKTLDIYEIYEIDDELKSKNINTITDKLDYVKKNYGGQIYMNFMLKTLDDVILMNYHKVNNEFTFSMSAIDGLLRSYFFATGYMLSGLPEHVYSYTKSKISTFEYELLKQFKENENLQNI